MGEFVRAGFGLAEPCAERKIRPAAKGQREALPFVVPLQGSNRKPARKVGFLGGFVRAGFGLAEPCVNLVMCKKYLVIHG